MIGTMASIMASTIINVAVPDISRVFQLGQERAQWLSAGFMASVTLSMLTTPWLLARFGYRHAHAMSASSLLLLTGGVVGGSSPWFGLVLAMRVVRGPRRRRAAADPGDHRDARACSEPRRARQRRWASSASASCSRRRSARACGGVLVEWFGWRSIFFVVTPFCLFAALVLMARRYLPIHGPGDAPISIAGGLRLDVRRPRR